MIGEQDEPRQHVHLHLELRMICVEVLALGVMVLKAASYHS